MNADEVNDLVREFSVSGFWTRVLSQESGGELLVVLDVGTRRVMHVFEDQGHARLFLVCNQD